MTGLPASWAEVPFGDLIVNLKNGLFVSRPGIDVNGVPILRVSAIRTLSLDLADVRYTGLTVEQVDAKKALISPGDLLFTRLNGNADYVGACAAVPEGVGPVAHSDKQIRATLRRELIDPRFAALAFAFPRVRADVRSRVRTTAGQASISGGDIKQVMIPLPPLGEQLRIVATLEDHLSRLDASVELLEKSLARSASLWRRLLSDLATPPPGESWETTQLGALAKFIKNGMFVSRPGSEPNGVPILRIGAVRPLSLDTSDVRYSSLDMAEVDSEGYLLEAGDLLFTRYNGNPRYVGSCAVVPTDTGPLTYPDKLIRVVVDRARAHPEFVAIACSFGPSREAIQRSVKTTAGQAGISGRDLRAIPIQMPPLEEQARHIKISAAYNEDLTRLNAAIKLMRERSARLRRSLLTEAFAGRLAPQDPEDEPASVLLERVKAERATVPAAKRRGSRTGSRTAAANGGSRTKSMSNEGQETVA